MRKSLDVLKSSIKALVEYKTMNERKETKDMYYKINLATAEIVIKELDLMVKCSLVNKYKLPKELIKYNEPLPKFMKDSGIASKVPFNKIEYKVQGMKADPQYVFERVKTYFTYTDEFLELFDNYMDEDLFNEIYEKQEKNLAIVYDKPVPFMRPNWELLLMEE